MKKEYCKYLISVLIFGTNGIVASHIHLTSYEIVLFRTIIGSIFLIGLFFLTRQKVTFIKHRRDTLFIALSGVSMGASWALLYEGYAQLGVSIGTLIYYFGPVLVMIVSPLIFREKLTVAKLTGFVSVLMGIVFINGISVEKINVWGISCGILSAITYAFMVIFNKKAKIVGGLENAAIQLFFSFITVSLFVFLKTGFRFTVLPGDWPWIALLGVVNTGVGCYLFFSSIGRIPVQTVAICGYIEPLAAVILSAVLLHELMSPLQIVGAVLILGGALFGECYGLFFTKQTKKA